MMSDMPVVITDERPLTLAMILGMAPDYATLRAAETLAEGASWLTRGASPVLDNRLVWATFDEGRRPATRTAFSLPHLHAWCSCGANRFPCRHILALLLRDADEPAGPQEPPDWAVAAHDRAARVARAGQGPDDAGDRRLPAVAAGLDDLGRWLADQVSHGLATLPARGKQPWLDAADRLVDAYAPSAAREMRALATIPGSSHDWPERLLPRLGRLALLAQAFSRLDDLPAGERGDVLAAAGRPPRVAGDVVADEWLVAGCGQTAEGRQLAVRLWLRGARSGRWALLEEFRPRPRTEGFLPPVGAVVDGELGFSPSTWPLLAQPLAPLRWVGEVAGKRDTLLPGQDGHDIDTAVTVYAAARAANPWLRLFPMLLTGVFVEPAEPWRLRDRAGRLLPLPPGFGHGWQLLALGADRPLTLFGEWDGATLRPLSVLGGDGLWRAMIGWKAYP